MANASQSSSTNVPNVSSRLVEYGPPNALPHERLHGFLAEPSDGLPHPGVVLIQEWWGLEPHITELAERLATAGYIVMAPDLYHGQVATEPDEAAKALMALNQQQAVAEIGQAVAYLIGRSDVRPKKVGVVGFCMGGLLAWRAAEAENGRIAAAAPFYAGYYQPTAADIAKVTAPVLVVWGETDRGIPAAQREHVVNLLKQEGKTFKALVYPAGHAFMNDHHATYNPTAAAEAWSELLAWFKQYLG